MASPQDCETRDELRRQSAAGTAARTGCPEYPTNLPGFVKSDWRFGEVRDMM
jgi:hypothetical protein